jgi:putative transposase
VSSTALAALEAEWARCRWIWNECVARSKKAHTEDEKCGPARLDKMLTQARTANGWLREGSSVPQQQLIRDFGTSRAKALKDIKARLPMRQRAGMPKYKKKHAADTTLNYTQRGFRLKDGGLHLAGGISPGWSSPQMHGGASRQANLRPWGLPLSRARSPPGGGTASRPTHLPARAE